MRHTAFRSVQSIPFARSENIPRDGIVCDAIARFFSAATLLSSPDTWIILNYDFPVRLLLLLHCAYSRNSLYSIRQRLPNGKDGTIPQLCALWRRADCFQCLRRDQQQSPRRKMHREIEPITTDGIGNFPRKGRIRRTEEEAEERADNLHLINVNGKPANAIHNVLLYYNNVLIILKCAMQITEKWHVQRLAVDILYIVQAFRIHISTRSALCIGRRDNV